MGPHLRAAEMIETESDQGINLKAIRLDRIVTGFADAERAGIDSLQGGVDLSEEIVQVSGGHRSGSSLEPSATLKELRSDIFTGSGGSRVHFSHLGA